MAHFHKFYATLMKHEGGAVEHPNDPGGATKWGVTLQTWRRYGRDMDGDGDIDKDDLFATSQADCAPLYKREYWDPLGLDGLHNQSVAELVFDHGVNAGPSRAAHMLQYVLNYPEFNCRLKVDGQIGPKTLAAANAVDQLHLHAYFKTLRRDFYNYRAMVLNNTNKHIPFFKGTLNLKPATSARTFINGWLNRVASFSFRA